MCTIKFWGDVKGESMAALKINDSPETFAL